MLKIYANENEKYSEIEFSGSLKTLAIETTFVIAKIYQEMLEEGKEYQAHEYRELLECGLSKALEGVDRMQAFNKQPPAEIQDLLDEILKRRR